MQSFQYKQAHKIVYWGAVYDSILELKYAISISRDYQFLRAHIPIYYNPSNYQPTLYIRDNIRRYTADFLVRHKETGEAFLVEIKPRAFAGDAQLDKRKQIAENYIDWKQYDWKFKVVFDDEIFLDEKQWAEFNHYRQHKISSARWVGFEKMNKRFDRSAPSFFGKVPDTRCIQFVMFGHDRQKNHFLKG